MRNPCSRITGASSAMKPTVPSLRCMVTNAKAAKPYPGVYGRTEKRAGRTGFIGALGSERRMTIATRPEFTVKWMNPAASPAKRSEPVLRRIQKNAPQAATLARHSLATLKLVRNQPFRLRTDTPIGSARAPTAAPTGPKVTERPSWTNGVGTHETLAPGLGLIAKTDIRKIVTPAITRVTGSAGRTSAGKRIV